MDRQFDPFIVIPRIPWLARLKAQRLRVSLPALLGLLAVVAIAEGTTGGPQDIRPLDDVRLALGTTQVSSPPQFPLMRDLLTVWIVVAIALTLAIVNWQWKLMATCVRELEQAGAIKPRHTSRPSRLLRAGERLFPRQERDPDPLDTVMRHARSYVGLLRSKLTWPLILLAVAGSVWILIGVRPNLFSEVVPAEISPQQEIKWLDQTYSSWWASPDHPTGAFAYCVILAFGIYLVLMQNAIGLVCSYFVLTLPKVAQLDADWLDRDGLYGWRPIALIFRSVYWSLALHGITLAFVVVALGSDHVLLILPLLIVWMVVAPIYIGGSIIVFRRVEKSARSERLAAVESEMQFAGISTSSPVAALSPFIAEIKRARCAKIRPLSLGWVRESAIFSAYILPLLLAIAQLAAA